MKAAPKPTHMGSSVLERGKPIPLRGVVPTWHTNYISFVTR